MHKYKKYFAILLVSITIPFCQNCSKSGFQLQSAEDSNSQGGNNNLSSEEPWQPPAASTPQYSSKHPKVYFSDQATLDRMKGLLANNVASAVRFKTLVDAQLAGGNAYAYKHWNSAMMYQITGNKNYCDHAIAGVDTYVQSEEALIVQNKRANVAFDSYLYVGERLENIFLVYDWCYDFLTNQQKERWFTYGNQAVWNVWNPTQAKWGNTVYTWSGWSTNNPANNYYFSFIRATMLLGLATLGDNPQAQQWLDYFRINKIQNQLVPKYIAEIKGGGSPEGTGYGTAMASLFELYNLWNKSTGERIELLTPHAKESIAYFLHTMTPTLNKIAPTGDHARDSSASLFDYHRNYLLQLMQLFSNDKLSQIAKTFLSESTTPQMNINFMKYSDYMNDETHIVALPKEQLNTAYYAEGVGHLFMRSSWQKDAVYSKFLCGAWNESHGHRDQGSFVIFKQNWLAFDANQASHSGIIQDEYAHNLVRIEDGSGIIKQQFRIAPCEMKALVDNSYFTYVMADVTPMYKGKTAITKVEREYLFIKPSTFIVFDRVGTSSAGTNKIWTLNLPQAPTVDGNNLSMTVGSQTFNLYHISPGIAPQVTYLPTFNTIFNSGFRIDYNYNQSTDVSFLNVIGIDNSVQRAQRIESAEQLGVQISFADGRSATIYFNRNAPGGSLRLLSPTGTEQHNSNLSLGLNVPPVLKPAN